MGSKLFKFMLMLVIVSILTFIWNLSLIRAFVTKPLKTNNFNFSRCSSREFKIYVYPRPKLVKSFIFEKIVNITLNSLYYTSNHHEACLFLPQIDTLDRDPLSKNYISNLSSVILNLSLWNNGENHVFFNHYSGTWPSYHVYDLELNIGKAIRIQASLPKQKFRSQFDISFPLFHQNFNQIEIPLNNNKTQKKYFLSFKGKRYLIGVGSQIRNSLYHLNNNRDIIMLTTCNHISNIKFIQSDEKCEPDEELYNKYDYDDLLYNSTFCLVPRGRRLGTFRFLEALRAGCIPVLLSNSIVLPFHEIIDWTRAVISIDEHRITQIPSILRKISHKKIEKMRNHGLFVYEKYFSSTETIVLTSYDVIRKRVCNHENGL